MRRALVTGVQGQDGYYLTDRLLSEGWEVHGLARDEDAHLEIDDRVVLHRGDLADRPALAALVETVEPDHVYNLGGISSVAYSWQHPVLTAEVSGLAPIALMSAALDVQGRTGRDVRFVQASSAELFGEPATSPQDESTPIAPLSPYGAAKAMAHHACRVFRQHGLHASSAILYNHESPRRPESFVTRKITSGVAAIARGESDELVLGNLDARRDWGWAPDYVDAMLRAAAHEEAMDVVIGTGRSYSVRDFVAAAFEAAGITDWERHVRVDPRFVRPRDPTELRADATRARAELGWRPTVEFAEVVSRMVAEDLR